MVYLLNQNQKVMIFLNSEWETIYLKEKSLELKKFPNNTIHNLIYPPFSLSLGFFVFGVDINPLIDYISNKFIFYYDKN